MAAAGSNLVVTSAWIAPLPWRVQALAHRPHGGRCFALQSLYRVAMAAPTDPSPRDTLLGTLDRALRGGYLTEQALGGGRVDVPVRRLVALALLLGAIYGVSLGCYALFRGADHAALQIVANAWKVPLLFVLTLLVTFPSLYVFAALQRLPLGFGSTLRLLLLATLVHLAVAASLGPVFAFFAASTTSYPFLLLLNVAFFAVGGLLGFMVLRRATRTIYDRRPTTEPAPAPRDPSQPPPMPMPARSSDSAGERTRRALAVWCAIYAVVGAQMSWLLRPFLGAPDQPFSLFRPREDNWLIGVLRTIADLFQG